MAQSSIHTLLATGAYAAQSRFASTAWMDIVKAQRGDDETSRHYMGLLIQRYWRPVYHFLRRSGRQHEDAKDLTQDFFTAFLEKRAVDYADREKGRFRNFVIASLKRFLAEGHRRSAVRPREIQVADFDTAMHERCVQSLAVGDPEMQFTRDWVKCLVENCLARLREECSVLGKDRQFDVFRARFVEETGHRRPSYADIAQLLGISQKDVENLLARAKKRFHRIFREEVRNSVLSDGDIEGEIRELLGAVSQ